MDNETGIIHFGNTLKVSAPNVPDVLNLAKMVVSPKLTVNLTGTWVRSAGNQETLHIKNGRVHGHPSFILISRIQLSEVRADGAQVALQKDDAMTPSDYCAGVLDYTAKTIVWNLSLIHI